MLLDAELALFESKRLEWVHEHSSKFVVIQDAAVLGFYDEWETAFHEGAKAFGAARPFLIKEVLAQDRVIFYPSIF